jgi:hypothetical protein
MAECVAPKLQDGRGKEAKEVTQESKFEYANISSLNMHSSLLITILEHLITFQFQVDVLITHLELFFPVFSCTQFCLKDGG